MTFRTAPKEPPLLPIGSLDELRRALDADISLLTDDDIIHGPDEAIDAKLAALGLEGPAASEETLLSLAREFGEGLGAADQALPTLRPAPRGRFVLDLLEVIEAAAVVHLRGAAGSGKSTFLHEYFLRHGQVRARFRQSFVIDCRALRMKSPVLFGREAVCAYFGLRDNAFRRFLTEAEMVRTIGGESNGDAERDRPVNPLEVLLDRRLLEDGLVIFDHVEQIDRSGAMDQWFRKVLLPVIEARKGRALFIQRAPNTKRPLASLKGAATLEFPSLTRDDIEIWLDQPGLLHHHDLRARAVLALTGARPSLLRDLGLYLRDAPADGFAALRGFYRERLRLGFMQDTERLVRRARRQFPVLSCVFAEGGLREAAKARRFDDGCRGDLVSSGAVKVNSEGALRFSSPLYARRIAELLQGGALATLATRANLNALHRDKAWKALWRYAEVAGDPLAKCIGHEREAVAGLQKLVDVLSRWDFKAQIFLRDADNARLWGPFDRPERLGAFEPWQQPEFAVCAQQGRTVVSDEDGRVFIPITGNSGMVEMVIAGHFQASMPSWTRPVQVERLVGILNAIRPTLAQVIQRVALQRERRVQSRLLHRSKSGGRHLYHGILREAGCEGLFVYRRAEEGWKLIEVAAVGDEPRGMAAMEWVQRVDETRLDQTVYHPTKNGVTVSGVQARRTFPALNGDVTIFLHPIIRLGEQPTIVGFVFLEHRMALTGREQKRLSLVAPDVSARAG